MRFTLPYREKSPALGYSHQLGNWLDTYTQSLKDKATSWYEQLWIHLSPGHYYSTVTGLKGSAAQEDFFLEAQQEVSYQQYRHWRTEMATELRLLQTQLLQGEKRPADLRNYLAAKLQQLPSSVVSPLYYQKKLAKLNARLAKSTLTSFYQVILEEGEDNLRKVLTEQSEAALKYFYQDIKNHLIEIAGERYSTQKLIAQLAFYQDLVPKAIYSSVAQSLEQAFATKVNYKNLLMQLNQLFSKTINEETIETEINSPSEPTFQKFLFCSDIAITTMVAASAVALGLYANAKTDSTNSYSLLSQPLSYFNLPDFHPINLILPAYIVGSITVNYGSKHSFQGISPSYNSFGLGLLSSLSMLATSHAQTTGGNWQNSMFFMSMGGEFNEEGLGITPVPTDRSLAVTGYTSSYGVGTGGYKYNAFVAKLRANGNLEWLNVLQSFYPSQGIKLVALADGSLVFNGFIIGPQANAIDLFVAKIAANGTLAWTRSLGGYNNEKGGSIVALADGSTIVGGYETSFGVGANNEFFVAKIGANGSLIWARDLGGSAEDAGNDLAQVLTDGSLGLVGTTYSFGATDYNVLVTKLHANGTLIWATTLSGSGNDEGIGIAAQSDGSLVFTGSTINSETGNKDILVAKLQANNTLAWMRTLGGFDNFNAVGYSIIGLADGNLALVGTKINVTSSNSQEIVVAKIQANNGALQWARSVGKESDTNSGYDVKELVDGSLVLTGHYVANFASNTNNDILIIKLDSNGLLADCTIPQTTLWPSNMTSLWQVANLNVSDVTTAITQRDITAQVSFQDPARNITSFFITPNVTTACKPAQSSVTATTLATSSGSNTPYSYSTSDDIVPKSSSKTPNNAPLIGGIVGGVSGIVIICSGVVVFVWYRKHKKAALDPVPRPRPEPAPITPKPKNRAIVLNDRAGQRTYITQLTEQELAAFDKKIKLNSYLDAEGYHVVGKGNFGKAYKALAAHLHNKPVIVKENTNPDALALEAAKNEAQLQRELGQLQNIMPLLDYLSKDGKLLIFMPAALLTGKRFQELYSRLSDEPLFPSEDKLFTKNKPSEIIELAQDTARLRREIAIHLAMDLLRALADLQGKTVPVIHHDIKPDNILFRDNGEANLADFGCAKKEAGPITDFRVGDVRYKSGEQLEVEQGKTASYQGNKRDIFGLALALLEMLAGEYPLDASISEIRRWTRDEFAAQRNAFNEKYGDKLPEGMMAFLLKLTHPNPDKRPTPQEALGDKVFEGHAHCTFFSDPKMRKRAYKRMARLPERPLEPNETVVRDTGYDSEEGEDSASVPTDKYYSERNPEHYSAPGGQPGFFKPGKRTNTPDIALSTEQLYNKSPILG